MKNNDFIYFCILLIVTIAVFLFIAKMVGSYSISATLTLFVSSTAWLCCLMLEKYLEKVNKRNDRF